MLLYADDHESWVELQNERTALYVMPVYEEENWGFTALILMPTGEKNGQFCRVGLMDPYAKEAVDALKEAMSVQSLSGELYQGRDGSGRYMIELV